MRRLRRVKIVATLGPASQDRDVVVRLFEAGVDVFRINMSHGSHDNLRERVQTIRSIEKEQGRPIGILVDLQGPKLRVGEFKGGSSELKKGAKFVLDASKTPGDAKRVYLPHPEILAALAPGHTILIDDGKLALHVIEASAEKATCLVDVGGKISNRKGVSLPDTDIPVSAMTSKDRSDLEAALHVGVDWIAVSFVQRPEDIADVKKTARGRALVLAKIEKPQAIARLDEIIEISDALMVARGDLGVEMPLEKVPGVQKLMTRMGRRAGKPVVVATQMLESMITSPVPTRAEVSDVATAIFDGADAVMLSGETAAGKYPIDSVVAMRRIAQETESWLCKQPPRALRSRELVESDEPAAVLARSMSQMATDSHARAIIAWTDPRSVRFISQTDVNVPIYAFGATDAELRTLALLRGVCAIRIEHPTDSRDFVRAAERILRGARLLSTRDRVVVATGFAGHGTERLWLRQVGATAV